MIKEKHIKPIPDRLLKRLEKIDSESLEKIRFYRYYTIFNRELCMVYVAAKTYRRKRYFKQPAPARTTMSSTPICARSTQCLEQA